MRQILFDEIKNVTVELADYLESNDKSEINKSFILGELCILVELLKEI